MSPEFIAVAFLFIVGIVIMGIACAIVALAEDAIRYIGKKMAEKELHDAGFETDGFVSTDEDGTRWLVGYKKD